MGRVHANKYRSAYFANVCVRGGAEVTIRSIEPVGPRGGLEVTDFSVVPETDDSRSILGGSRKRLRDEPSYSGGRTVVTSCTSEHRANLFVEVYKPGREDAEAREFTIEYAHGDRHRSAKLLFGFGLCEEASCDDVDPLQ